MTSSVRPSRSVRLLTKSVPICDRVAPRAGANDVPSFRSLLRAYYRVNLDERRTSNACGSKPVVCGLLTSPIVSRQNPCLLRCTASRRRWFHPRRLSATLAARSRPRDRLSSRPRPSDCVLSLSRAHARAACSRSASHRFALREPLDPLPLVSASRCCGFASTSYRRCASCSPCYLVPSCAGSCSRSCSRFASRLSLRLRRFRPFIKSRLRLDRALAIFAGRAVAPEPAPQRLASLRFALRAVCCSQTLRSVLRTS